MHTLQSEYAADTVASYHNIHIDSTAHLVIYVPHFSRIDLVCGEMPRPTDTSVVFTCEAAFTGQLKEDFDHENIAGNHVASGVFYKGYACTANTGAFVYYEGAWKFVYDNYAGEVARAADRGGMAFGQILFIKAGLFMPTSIKGKHVYRALCEWKGKLCIIESKQQIAFMTFVKYLGRLGVKHALYLDMGEGWNHSWYRDNDGMAQEIHPKTHNYGTNWITFYQ